MSEKEERPKKHFSKRQSMIMQNTIEKITFNAWYLR